MDFNNGGIIMTKETAMKILKELHDNSIFSNRTALETLIPELKDSNDERIRKALIELVKQSSEILSKSNQDGMLAWLEKQGEQKHINDTDEEIVNAVKDTSVLDLVEPKFKVGDWVVYECGEDSATLQIKNIIDSTYEFTDDSTLNVVDEDTLRLWTIQDAKDGDVLVAPPVKGSEYSEQIFIFKEIKDREYVKNAVEYYCRCINNEFAKNKHGFMGQSDDYFTPATKEQRDLLFQKMKEFGYDWDADKKELKLFITNGGDFEPQQEWSEEDKRMCQETIDWFEKKCFPYALEEENPARESIKWLKSLKDRVQPQPKQEWSEEDEKIRKGLIKGLSAMRDIHHHQTFSDDAININEALAWLEKQGDKDKLIKELGEYKVKYTQEVLSQQLEKQGKQKPTEVRTIGNWHYDDKYEVKAGDSISANGKPFDYEKATITQKDFASVGETATIELSSPIDCGDRIYHVSHKPIEKNGEQKPTWSDEDEKMSENILSHLRKYYVQKKGYPYVADLNSPEMEEFRWLKSLKDRMKGREDKQ